MRRRKSALDVPPPDRNARSDIEFGHPNLTKYKINSRYTKRYNCVAYAAGDNQNWWWPNEDDYWPEEAPMEATVGAFIRAFMTLGYSRCEGHELEIGYEKIAIYVGEFGKPKHVAKQVQSGAWASKMGSAEDIIHQTLQSLEDHSFGRVAVVMKRVSKQRVQ